MKFGSILVAALLALVSISLVAGAEDPKECEGEWSRR